MTNLEKDFDKCPERYCENDVYNDSKTISNVRIYNISLILGLIQCYHNVTNHNYDSNVTNFSEGAVDIFDDHSILNECDEFDMKNSPGNSIIMTLLHTGNLVL